MVIYKLEKMPYAQAHVEFSENGIALFSYNTLAAYIDPEGWLSVHCLCSQTTRRHVSAFVAEYAGLEYSVAKMLHKDGLRMNVKTGELDPAD